MDLKEAGLVKPGRDSVTPPPFSADACGAVWVSFGVSGWYRAWYIKTNTVFYLPDCFDCESTAITAAEASYGYASHSAHN